ncbi:ImmA/IrrE family metallo-endopeptidase [Bradyrhizobium sp. USDA 4452]
MKVAPIRNEQDYDNALKRMSDLLGKADRASKDEAEVLQALTEKWERENHDLLPPTPLEAIRFRMKQQGLEPRDLVPMIGPRSRVSEILKGRRSLTLDMIRALHRDLGIPLKSLVGEDEDDEVPKLSKAASEGLAAFGIMKEREGYAAFRMRAFDGGPPSAYLRKTRTLRTNAKTDTGALEAWCAAVLLKAETVKLPKKRSVPYAEFGRTLARLSAAPNGPTLVAGALAGVGIIFLALRHLPGTYLDGAALCRNDGTPIIALTIRHDRIDNFWFTLLHEYCHACHHLNGETNAILDDLEVKSTVSEDDIEHEADMFAQNALLPPSLSAKLASPELTPEDIEAIAEQAGVHPAIVAGRWQREHADYRRFSKMLGRGEVSALLFNENDDH